MIQKKTSLTCPKCHAQVKALYPDGMGKFVCYGCLVKRDGKCGVITASTTTQPVLDNKCLQKK